MLKTIISLIIGAIIWIVLLFSYNAYTWVWNAKQTNFRSDRRGSFSWQVIPSWWVWFGSGAMMWSWTFQGRPWKNMTQEQQIEMINQRTWIAKELIKIELDAGKTMRQIISENSSTSWTGAKISWTGASL
jgi:hypothetical protein